MIVCVTRPGGRLIEARRAQRSFGDGFITAEIKDLQEPWMAHVDAMLADEAMVSAVHQALVQRHPQSCRRGRPGFPAEVVLRLLVLKHIRNWSYAVLEREVRPNLVYRDFTRVGAAKMPDAKTMGRWGVAMGPTVIHQIHDRIVQIHRGGEQHPLSHRQQPIGRRGPGADAHHAENNPVDWPGWRQAARPEPERRAAAVGD